MADGRRARAEQVAKRVNTATEFLDEGMDVIDATRDLARRYRLSERQARRYVERARDEGAMEVPGRKVVFTVKLPAGLWPAVCGAPPGDRAEHLRACLPGAVGVLGPPPWRWPWLSGR